MRRKHRRDESWDEYTLDVGHCAAEEPDPASADPTDPPEHWVVGWLWVCGIVAVAAALSWLSWDRASRQRQGYLDDVHGQAAVIRPR